MTRIFGSPLAWLAMFALLTVALFARAEAVPKAFTQSAQATNNAPFVKFVVDRYEGTAFPLADGSALILLIQDPATGNLTSVIRAAAPGGERAGRHSPVTFKVER